MPPADPRPDLPPMPGPQGEWTRPVFNSDDGTWTTEHRGGLAVILSGRTGCLTFDNPDYLAEPVPIADLLAALAVLARLRAPDPDPNQGGTNG